MSETTHPTCHVVRAGETVTGKQALDYNVGVSAESVGAQALHMQIVTIPPGARAKAHKHESHETAIYALEGVSHCYYGENLEHCAVVEPGDFFYIPANMPHLPCNPSDSRAARAVIARTDPNEQESVVLLPELEKLQMLGR